MIKFTPGKWVANYKGTIGHIKALPYAKFTIDRIDEEILNIDYQIYKKRLFLRIWKRMEEKN